MGIGSGSPASLSGESQILRQIARQPGHLCVLDAGANSGQFAELALSILPRQRSELHCFEPAAQAYQLLQQRLSTMPNVRLNQCAVGGKTGRSTLWADAPGSSLASLTQRDISHCGMSFDHSEQVDVITLDEYCASANIPHIHLLKLDVEGHELEALQGAQQLLTNRRIETITFEFGGCNIDTRTFFRDFWRFFEQHSMRLYRITPSGHCSAIVEYGESLEKFRVSNYIARLER